MQQAPTIIQIPRPAIPPTPPIVEGGPRILQMPTRPVTGREVQALKERRSALSDQLQSVERRRERTAAALEDAEGANKAGLEQRLIQLDQRILQIESEIAENSRQLALAPPSLLASTASTTTAPATDFGGLSSGQVTAIGIVGTIFVFFPLALALARSIWRRGSRAPVAPASAESAQRMERLEQAVDAIAIEVERISEGQRFMTKLLTEGAAPMLSVGHAAAEALPVSHREPTRASRESA